MLKYLFQVFLLNYWYNVDAPFASDIEYRDYSFFQKRKKPHHKELYLNLSEDLLGVGHPL